jgi:hypothetical protein
VQGSDTEVCSLANVRNYVDRGAPSKRANTLVPTQHFAPTASSDARWTEVIRNVRFIEKWAAMAAVRSWPTAVSMKAVAGSQEAELVEATQ